jgi:hypothetical protein
MEFKQIEMSSGGAYAFAVSMNNVQQTVRLRREKLETAKERLLSVEEQEEADDTETELIETIRFPYPINNGFCIIL